MLLHRLSLVEVSGGCIHCGVWAPHCHGFSSGGGAQTLGTRALVAAACRLRSCETQA